MAHDVAWSPTAKRAVLRLPEKVATAVAELIYGPLGDNPRRVGKALRFDLEGLHSARRGDFRVIYRISEGPARVTVVAIEHRADAYRSR